MKETFRELLAKTNGELCQNSEFIELNKFRMVQLGHINSKDYEIFWGCMKLYDQFGVNYFDEYLSLRCGVYGCFSHGISAWFQQEVASQRSPVDSFLSIVDIIRFFELPSYDGIPFSEYEYAYNHVHLFSQIATQEVIRNHQEKANKTIEKKIADYFNFSSFSQEVFSDLFQNIVQVQTRHFFSIKEAIEISKRAPANTYIVLLKRGESVCHVSKTNRLLSFIEKKHTLFSADNVAFVAVDREYADDLVIALLDYYSLLPNKVQINEMNRKYADLNTTIYVYQRNNTISKKHVLAAIARAPIRTIETNSGQVLIDKVQLYIYLQGCDKPQ